MGLSLSPNDGPTHHGLFDISFLRCIPNATIMAPSDEDEFQDMIKTSIDLNSPAFIRYPRGNAVGVKLKKNPRCLEIGKAKEIYSGNNISIWAIGDFVLTAKKIADYFKSTHNFSISVVNARFAKPLDKTLLMEHAKNHEYILTLEDGVLDGGFGAAVIECLNDNGIKKMVKRFGWPDKFIEHGSSVNSLRKLHGLDSETIIKSIEKLIKHNLKAESILV